MPTLHIHWGECDLSGPNNCLAQDSMDEVGDCGGLGGNLMFLPSTSMQDKIASILENSLYRDDA